MAERRLGVTAGIVGIAVLGSRVLGVVREATFTTLFGAGRELDAFIAAFRIPNLFRDLLAEGALSVAFVTTFTRKLERDGEGPAWDLASRVITNLVMVVSLVVGLGIIFAPFLVDLVAPGFRAEPGKAELTIDLTRLLFPFLLFVALAAAVMGILNARSVFGVPASASMFFNLGSVIFGLGFTWVLAPDYLQSILSHLSGEPVPPPPGQAPRALVGMALGTLAGGALQLLIQIPSLRRVGFRYRVLAGFTDPGVREVLRLMGPAAIGVAAVQVNVVVNTYFASTLGNGPVSWLGVAFRLMYVPIGVIGVALGTAVLPRVSRAAERRDSRAFRDHVTEALEILLVLCIPAAAGLALVADPLIGMIYEHGRFTAADSAAAGQALSAYALGLTGYAAIKVLGPSFYALGDSRTPMRVSLLSIATNVVLNWTAVRVLDLGHAGLALATSIVALLNAVLLLVLLRRRSPVPVRQLTGTMTRTLVATGLMTLLCAVWMAWIDTGTRTLIEQVTVIGTTVPLGLVTFFVAGRPAGYSDVNSRRFAAEVIGITKNTNGSRR